MNPDAVDTTVGGICTDQQCEKHSRSLPRNKKEDAKDTAHYRQPLDSGKKKPAKKHHAKANSKNRHTSANSNRVTSANQQQQRPLLAYGPPQFVPHPIGLPTCICALNLRHHAHPCCPSSSAPPLYVNDVMMTQQPPPPPFVTATSVDGTTYYHHYTPADQPPPPPPFIYPPPPVPIIAPPQTSTATSLSMTSSSSRCSSPSSSGGGAFDLADLRAIAAAAEGVFSAAQLDKNLFLKRKLASSRRGYVSVKLLAQMNSVRKTVKDAGKLLAALRTSTRLELNADATKIRVRGHNNNNAVSSCRHSNNSKASSSSASSRVTDYASLLLIDLDEELGKIDVLLSKFAGFGDILQIRIVPSDRPLPPYLRNYSAIVPQLGKVKCATVEFQHFNNAQKACDWSKKNNYTSVLLGPRLKRAIANQQKYSKSNPAHEEEEDEVTFTDDTASQQSSSERLPMCYRLDSGNSLDSGLECCSSSVGSMESDAATSESNNIASVDNNI